ncbi:dTMP kinase [Amylibacter sp. SFDW26]|uniref:dTMP kinase n=1 Tax=Amylibacter sp. SFDW26 TaxID=2652722 RepID=UPI002106DEB2|nr:dTMP kinase [Amylibacter sp. SFDW26]
MFITFEGIDGSGKSTQAKALVEALKSQNVPCTWTREPGGSEGAEAIRKLLVEGDPNRWSAETEILLFNAARRDHLEKTIAPALERGETIVCDRFVDSTRIYQGVVRADLRETVDIMHKTMIGREADLTFIIDIDPEVALTRGLARNSGEDRFEDMGLQFQKDLRAGFLELAKQNPERCKIIDGSQSMEDVGRDVLAAYESAQP